MNNSAKFAQQEWAEIKRQPLFFAAVLAANVQRDIYHDTCPNLQYLDVNKTLKKKIMPFSNLRDPIHVQHDWWFQSQLKFML